MRIRHFTAKLFHLSVRANFTEKSSLTAAQKKRYCEFVKKSDNQIETIKSDFLVKYLVTSM